MHSEPWVLAPQLKQEYLSKIAQLLVQVRGEVIDRHEPEIGDTRLSLGMRAYECCRMRMIYQAQQGEWSWFTILTPEGRFTFAIDGIPVRFSRNEPSQLPKRKLIPSGEGFRQMSLFSDMNEYATLRWFFIIDANYDMPVEKAYFVGYSEYDEIICKWEIPLEEIVPALGEISEEQPQAKDIPPAPIKLKNSPSHDKSNEA